MEFGNKNCSLSQESLSHAIFVLIDSFLNNLYQINLIFLDLNEKLSIMSGYFLMPKHLWPIIHFLSYVIIQKMNFILSGRHQKSQPKRSSFDSSGKSDQKNFRVPHLQCFQKRLLNDYEELQTGHVARFVHTTWKGLRVFRTEENSIRDPRLLLRYK